MSLEQSKKNPKTVNEPTNNNAAAKQTGHVVKAVPAHLQKADPLAFSFDNLNTKKKPVADSALQVDAMAEKAEATALNAALGDTADATVIAVPEMTSARISDGVQVAQAGDLAIPPTATQGSAVAGAGAGSAAAAETGAASGLFAAPLVAGISAPVALGGGLLVAAAAAGGGGGGGGGGSSTPVVTVPTGGGSAVAQILSPKIGSDSLFNAGEILKTSTGQLYVQLQIPTISTNPLQLLNAGSVTFVQNGLNPVTLTLLDTPFVKGNTLVYNVLLPSDFPSRVANGGANMGISLSGIVLQDTVTGLTSAPSSALKTVFFDATAPANPTIQTVTGGNEPTVLPVRTFYGKAPIVLTGNTGNNAADGGAIFIDIIDTQTKQVVFTITQDQLNLSPNGTFTTTIDTARLANLYPAKAQSAFDVVLSYERADAINPSNPTAVSQSKFSFVYDKGAVDATKLVLFNGANKFSGSSTAGVPQYLKFSDLFDPATKAAKALSIKFDDGVPTEAQEAYRVVSGSVSGVSVNGKVPLTQTLNIPAGTPKYATTFDLMGVDFSKYAEGTNVTLTAVLEDLAGNQTTYTLVRIIDTVSPFANLVVQKGGIDTSGALVLNFDVSRDATDYTGQLVSKTAAGALVTATGDTQFNVAASANSTDKTLAGLSVKFNQGDIADGVTIVFNGTDKAGNVSTDQAVATVRTTNTTANTITGDLSKVDIMVNNAGKSGVNFLGISKDDIAIGSVAGETFNIASLDFRYISGGGTTSSELDTAKISGAISAVSTADLLAKTFGVEIFDLRQESSAVNATDAGAISQTLKIDATSIKKYYTDNGLTANTANAPFFKLDSIAPTGNAVDTRDKLIFTDGYSTTANTANAWTKVSTGGFFGVGGTTTTKSLANADGTNTTYELYQYNSADTTKVVQVWIQQGMTPTSV